MYAFTVKRKSVEIDPIVIRDKNFNDGNLQKLTGTVFCFYRNSILKKGRPELYVSPLKSFL